MNAVYDAHTAKQIIDVLNRGAAWQVIDLYEHGFYIGYVIFMP